jgi:hypothetical protein
MRENQPELGGNYGAYLRVSPGFRPSYLPPFAHSRARARSRIAGFSTRRSRESPGRNFSPDMSSPESTIQWLVVPNLDILDTPFRPLSAAESFSPPSASTTRVLSRQPTPYRYSSISTSQGSQSMSIDEPTIVRRTEPTESEEIMNSSQELSIRPLLLTPPIIEDPERPSGYTIHDMGPFQAWLPNSVQPDIVQEEIAQSANNSERIGSPDSVRTDKRPELYITNPASPAESLSSISSVSTQSTRVTQAPLLQSML